VSRRLRGVTASMQDMAYGYMRHDLFILLVVQAHSRTNMHMCTCEIPYDCKGIIPYECEGDRMRACRAPSPSACRTPRKTPASGACNVITAGFVTSHKLYSVIKAGMEQAW